MIRTHGLARLAFFTLFSLYLGAAALIGFSQAMTAAVSVDGTIVSIAGNTMTLTLADKTLRTVALQESTIILERVAATLEEIKAGDALGVAARRTDNALIATNINIFSAEMWDGVRKGQFPMTTGEVMTNALVTDYVTAVQGRSLTMKYNEGTTTITVPDGVPIHRLLTVKPAALVAGLHVVVRVTPSADGSLKAATVSFDQPAKG
ncbi:MAG: hypothetical protein ABSF77_11820 [Spirochaetia bacterium]|jgi:Cu/Ag efflux protein CusF